MERFVTDDFRGKILSQFKKGIWTKDISREGEEFKKGLRLFFREVMAEAYPKKPPLHCPMKLPLEHFTYKS